MAERIDETLDDRHAATRRADTSSSEREAAAWDLRFGLPQFVPGARVGRYLVLSELGVGGMGVVVAAYDPELDRKVAVKLLRPSGSEPATARTRLQREAQALAKLAHPNVVAVHDVGVHGGSIWPMP